MNRRRIERRLLATSDKLAAARTELMVANEQLAVFSDDADDARIRSLVSETPGAGTEFRDAQRHYRAMVNHRDDVAKRIDRLEDELNQLLDRYSHG